MRRFPYEFARNLNQETIFNEFLKKGFIQNHDYTEQKETISNWLQTVKFFFLFFNKTFFFVFSIDQGK